MAKFKRKSATALVEFEKAANACACANIRKLSRAVTQLFDQSLEPSGLRSTQLIILLEIATTHATTVPQLARRLIMDRSTVTRNLMPLAKKGLIKIDAVKDRRSQSYGLSPRGLKTLKDAVPLWQRAQARFVDELGEKKWCTFLANISSAVTAARR